MTSRLTLDDGVENEPACEERHAHADQALCGYPLLLALRGTNRLVAEVSDEASYAVQHPQRITMAIPTPGAMRSPQSTV